MIALLEQHEHCWEVLLEDLAKTQEQSEAFYLMLAKLYENPLLLKAHEQLAEVWLTANTGHSQYDES